MIMVVCLLAASLHIVNMYQSVISHVLKFSTFSSTVQPLGGIALTSGPQESTRLPDVPTIPWHELFQQIVAKGSLSTDDFSAFVTKWQGAFAQQLLHGAITLYLR